MTLSGFRNFWTSRDKAIVRRKTLMMFGAGVVLAFIAPYNTDVISTWNGRFLYWVGCVLFASLISGFVGRAVFPQLVRRNIGVVFSFLVFTALLSVPTSVWVLSWEITLIGLFVVPESFSASLLWDVMNSYEYSLADYLVFYGRVWVITMILVGPISLLGEKVVKPSSEIDVQLALHSRFLDRLPKELGRNLMCLSMEDHYVRAHTDVGDTLILMRMGDAVAELAGYPGMQVHRSWWVAEDAVKEVQKKTRRKNLLLKNGMQVPISQRREKSLREAGFI